MKRNVIKCLLVFFMIMLCFGCATQRGAQDWKTAFSPLDLNQLVRSGQYVQKVDNFEIIIDSSGSMAESYKGALKLNLAKNIVNRINQTIPDINLQGALRMFGRTATFNDKKTLLLYGLTSYSKAGLEEGLNKVNWPRGDSPLHLAMNASGGDLKPANGDIALIIVSDGKEMGKAPVKAAQDLKDQYGDRLCIYTVAVGNDKEGVKLLEQVAKKGECGFATTADAVSTPAGMANFVEKVFLKKASVARVGDADGDGVLDPDDKCPDTPKGVKVDSVGCPLDTDGDGVYDYEDECPDTPKGAKVNLRGCWVLDIVYFDTNKYDIKSGYRSSLDEVVDVLRQNPDLHILIEGHCDIRGTDKYNLKLSDHRAEAVRNYLVKAGIAADRIDFKGYGFHKPAVKNSPETWHKNRRSEIKPIR